MDRGAAIESLTRLAARARAAATGVWTAAAAVLVAAAAVWFLGDDPLARQERTNLAGQPDLRLTDAEIVQYREDGSRHYAIESGTAVWYRDGGAMSVASPSLVLPSPDGSPWRVSAASGAVTRDDAGDPEVSLSGSVRLRQDTPDGFVEVAASVLKVYPARSFVASDEPVRIRTGTGRIDAGRMRADLDQGSLRLEEVTGVLWPGSGTEGS